MRACWPSSKGWPRARPTATDAWPVGRRPPSLHLGPGLGNGLANLHNARRARTPLVNVVGDHATYPSALRRPAPVRYRQPGPSRLGLVPRIGPGRRSGGRRCRRRGGGLRPARQVATLVLPADVSWSPVVEPRPTRAATAPDRPRVAPEVVEAVAAALRRGEPTMLFLGGTALRAPGLSLRPACRRPPGPPVGRDLPGQLGAGSRPPRLHRLAYLAELAEQQLAGLRHLVLVDAAPPVSFFAYPGRASDLVPPGCQVHVLAGPGEDIAGCPGRPGRRRSARRAAGAPAAPASPAPTHAARSRPTPWPRPSGHSCPKGRWWSTRRITAGLFASAATAGAPRTTG